MTTRRSKLCAGCMPLRDGNTYYKGSGVGDTLDLTF